MRDIKKRNFVVEKNRTPRNALTFLIYILIISIVFSPASLFGQESAVKSGETVVLLHGLGRGKSIMDKMELSMSNAGYTPILIGYESIGRTPEAILADVTGQLNAVTADTNRRIHFVGHSLGGLLVRAYLDSSRLPHLGKVVLIGSPNKGTPLVDYFRDAWVLKLAGPIAAALGTDKNNFPRTLRAPYYPVGIIAGVSGWFNNDGIIPGEDDGVVPVESTKIEGMTDFIILPVSHSSLPKNEEVARQTIHFLKNGSFSKER